MLFLNFPETEKRTSVSINTDKIMSIEPLGPVKSDCGLIEGVSSIRVTLCDRSVIELEFDSESDRDTMYTYIISL